MDSTDLPPPASAEPEAALEDRIARELLADDPSRSSPPAASQTPPNRPVRIPPSTARVLVSIAVVFTLTFLFLRTILIEPFGVPTGSMAPTLIGNHREGPCPRCGYPVRVGLPTGERAGHFANVPCPNCGQKLNLSDTP